MCESGVFCPACQIYISLRDRDASAVNAERVVRNALEQFAKTFTIRLEL
jgi:hypothetical protein